MAGDYIEGKIIVRKYDDDKDYNTQWISQHFGPGPYSDQMMGAIKMIIALNKRVNILEKKINDIQHTF